MKRAALAGLSVTIISIFSISAFAGKEEREYMKSDLAPAVKEAETKFKASCGCALKITLNSNTTSTKDDMYNAKHIVQGITEGAPGYCNDADSKKAVCQLKTLDILKEKEARFTFKGGKGTASHDGQSNTTFEMITHELDK